jgi:hypothetical protein
VKGPFRALGFPQSLVSTGVGRHIGLFYCNDLEGSGTKSDGFASLTEKAK